MKKLIVLGLALVCVFSLVACSNSKDGNETVSFHDKTINKSELSEETLEWLEHYNTLSSEEQLAISSIPADLYKLCGYGNAAEIVADESETVSFRDKTFNKADLSEETLEWLEHYNTLSSEEQLAISSIPADLYKLCGYGNAAEIVADESGQTDYPPMVMFNDILYTATSYSGDKEDLSAVGKIESCIDYGVPAENNQANDPLVGCDIYTIPSAPDFIFVLNNGVYSPYKVNEVETVQYLDKTLNKSDLSAETLEWLEWFNGLSETGQLSVSFVPQEILELCGYVSTENSEVSGPTD